MRWSWPGRRVSRPPDARRWTATRPPCGSTPPSAGRVQGVGFRYFVLREATDLGLDGWVANTMDGSVRCVAEGPRDRLDILLDRLRDGPAGRRSSSA